MGNTHQHFGTIPNENCCVRPLKYFSQCVNIFPGVPGEAGGGGAGGHADGVLRGGRVPQQRGLHHSEGAAQHAGLHLQHPPLPHRARDALLHCCCLLQTGGTRYLQNIIQIPNTTNAINSTYLFLYPHSFTAGPPD